MKLTITTLVIVEGSYIQGIFHSLEEHPGKAYQELVDQVENEYGYDADKDHVPLHFKTIQDIENYFELVHIETQELTSTGFKTAIFKNDLKMNNMEPIITVNEYPIGWEWLDRVPLEDFTWLIEIFSTITDNTDTYDFAGGFIINDTIDYIEIYEIEIEDEPFDEFLGNIITYASEKDLFENLRENLIRMDLTKGADDQYYDYSPSQVEAILFGILQLTPEHQDIIVIDLKKHLKSFIQDKDQAEEMITQSCYYNAIKRWESNHKETEILHQLEILNLL